MSIKVMVPYSLEADMSIKVLVPYSLEANISIKTMESHGCGVQG